jgi:hypothetical protein
MAGMPAGISISKAIVGWASASTLDLSAADKAEQAKQMQG